MITWCENCKHKLWSEVQEKDGIRFTLYFDDEEVSDTYTEHVVSCPNCGLSLTLNAIEPIELPHYHS